MIAVNVRKVEKFFFYRETMRPKDADGMANSVDPNQTASSGAV